MELGAFSVSLNVSDITASKTFYENLGCTLSRVEMREFYGS